MHLHACIYTLLLADVYRGDSLEDMATIGLPDCTAFRLRMAARQATRHYDRHLAAAGINVAQFGLLAVIAFKDGLNVTELSTVLEMERTTLTRNLRPLARSRLVRLGHGPDRRSRAVHLTAAGAAKLKLAKPLWRKAQSSVAASLGEPDLADLHALLARTIEKLPTAARPDDP